MKMRLTISDYAGMTAAFVTFIAIGCCSEAPKPVKEEQTVQQPAEVQAPKFKPGDIVVVRLGRVAEPEHPASHKHKGYRVLATREGQVFCFDLEKKYYTSYPEDMLILKKEVQDLTGLGDFRHEADEIIVTIK